MSQSPAPTAVAASRLPIPPRDVAKIILIMALWGANYLAAKTALLEIPPFLLNALRFGVTALILCPLRFPPTRAQMPHILGLSLTLGSLQYALGYWSLSGLDAGTSAVLGQAAVPFSALLAAYFFRDHLGIRRVLGLILALCGVVLILGTPKLSATPLYPALALGAAFVWAAGNIGIKLLGHIDSLRLTGWTAFFAAPQLALASWIFERDRWPAAAHAGIQTWIAFTYTVLVVAIGSYMLWYPLVRRYPVNQIMPFTLLMPVFGVLAGILALGERPGPQMLTGAACTLGGVAVIVLRPRPAAAA
jgi:O-acetylserine/cysteine efflux transporter